MKLVVGLGNPGRKYEATRHNVGYQVLAELARRHAQGKPKEKFHAEVAEADLTGQKALLLCPTTYMNLSGTAVVAARDFYGLSNDQVLVICDDINLPLAKLRVRAGGSSGGQKGLADVIRRLQTEEFPRLRIGLGSPPAAWDASDFVLARFTPEEIPEIEEAVRRAADAVVHWAHEGTQSCMNRYNQTPGKE